MSVRRPGRGASYDEVVDWENERRQSLVEEDQADHAEADAHPCPQCGCMCGPSEWSCWRCGAVQPDEEED